MTVISRLRSRGIERISFSISVSESMGVTSHCRGTTEDKRLRLSRDMEDLDLKHMISRDIAIGTR